MRKIISRRESLYALGGIATLKNIQLGKVFKIDAGEIKIGACDWSLGFKSKIEALVEAKIVGLDGVQVSLGTAENNMHLRDRKVQNKYKKAVRETGIDISSLAIGELNKYPYKSDMRTIKWVYDSIGVAKRMNCKVILLAFFGAGDIKGDELGQKEVIRRLKDVMPKAEKENIIIGIESWLSADEHMRIIESVGSKNLKVYYDVANSHKMGYDIYKEILFLGDQICEIHMKENGVLLGHGEIDFFKVNEVMEEIGYSGWIQIEGAVPEGMSKRDSNKANNLFLQKIFSS